MKGDWVSDIDQAAKTVTICAAPAPAVQFALQYRSDGQWHWTCGSDGKAIPFTDSEGDREILAAVKDFETRRIPWANVPNQLKRLSDCGNRKERRKERAARRRELWAKEKRKT